ncbi:MAG TPA: acyltransferase [Anaerolineales bacterium]|nr:acyltransferase [Anaerolineales bacterium]
MVKRLLFVNGIAILGVILFHSSGMGFVAMLAWAGRYLPAGVSAADQVGSFSYYSLRAIEQIVVFSIPAFLFVSGYFAAVSTGRKVNTSGWSMIFSRIKTLLIPYFIWSAVVIALNMVNGSDYSVPEILYKLLTGGANEILYFVPLLVQFYLLSPFLVRLARKNPLGLLIVTAVIQTLVQSLPYHVLFGAQLAWVDSFYKLIPKWLFLSRIFWFPLGIVAGLYSEAFKRAITRLRGWAIGACVLLVPLGMIEWEALYRASGAIWLDHRETITDNLYSIVVLIMLLTYVRLSPSTSEKINSLGLRSYGIFLTHGIFIEYTAKVIYHVAPALLGYQFILQPVFIFIGLAGPLVIMYLVDRSTMRKMYAYIYG